MGLNSFFSPKSIAIVGASPKEGKLGNVLIKNIRKGGWKGKLYFVNPKYAKSRKDYFSGLGEIKKPVDLVLVAIPAPLVNEALENGAGAKPAIENFAIISSGFKETGKEGKILEENLEKIAEKYKLNVLGPNCLGFANPAEKLNATFTDVKLQKGNIAIVSQSGALAVALLDWAAGKNIGFSKIVSIGNKTVLDESEAMDFLTKDKNTKNITLYLEDIKDGSKFMQAVARTTTEKPIVILKAGKTSAGQKAITSHTGSLAQNGEIIEAVFEKLNVIPAEDIEEFQDLIYYLNFNSIPAKKEVIVLTNAGGPGVMASDFVGKSKNIKLLNFSADFQGKIKKYLPPGASIKNPIDVIGDAPPARYEKTLECISKYFPENPILAILTPQNQTDPEKVAQILAKHKPKIKNLSACFMGGEKIVRAKTILEKNGIANFDNPERALTVIEKLVKYSKSKKSRDALNASPAKTRRTQCVSTTNAVLQSAVASSRKTLFWSETEKLFGKYGVKLTKSISLENLNEIRNKKIPYPCALKTDDPNIIHRLEKKAVRLDIRNEKELRDAFGKMKKTTGLPAGKAGAAHFLLQPMAEPGLEMIIGMKRDPVFGPVILCGWGGSFTEIFKDKIVLIPPFDQNETKNKISELAIFPLLKGFRGEKGYGTAEILKIIAALSAIASENPEIGEIDINPVMLYNNGKEGRILDAKIFLK